MRRFTTSDGLGLAFRDEGAGLAVLCLAGLTRNMEDFDPVAAALAGQARVIRLDARGRGASDYDPNPANYHVTVEARDALELLDHLSIPRALVIGTSRGGMLAFLMGLAAHERLAGVVLNDIGPEIAPEGLAAIMAYVGLPPTDRDLDAAAARLRAQNALRFPGVALSAWRVWAARTYRPLPGGGLALRYDPAIRDALLAQAEAGPLPDLWPLFDGLAGIPLGLIRGANSDLLTAETAQRMRARRPDMRYAEIADRGHIPFLDEPGSLALIRAVLADAEAGGRP